MRVLVAGRNAKVLAKTAGTFANDLKISTAATKADCFTLLARTEFDLIVACETLADGSGLEVLSHVAVNTPNTLRIFAARPATLNLLKGELGLFGLFRTLPYPINFRKLWAAISLARSACGEEAPVRAPAHRPAPAAAPAPRVRHVVLEDGWQAAAPSAPTRTQQAPKQQRPTQQREITSGMRAAARYAAARATRDTAAQPARIPESETFKRARARRDTDRREPVMSNQSLAQLAKLAATKRPPPQFRGPPLGKKRAAFFVGSGVFAATTLAVLTFFMVNANNSMERSKLPMIASINQPIPQKVFPWQPETQQPTRQAAFMRSEASPAAVADLEAEAEAASETLDGDPDHPAPPPPNAPPPPSEPPSLESPAQPVDE